MTLQTSSALDDALLAAHAKSDLPDLVALYTQAADQAEGRSDTNAACFYLTHAFVFALEDGAAEADRLNKRLADYGCAKRLEF
ncbi:hypothetical protein [Yoonia sp. 208BN28-4]|uniref:hypothetical protein n=1 Tax=Yoonia sp. 208BN28-4 TaxID=3126505 RepID=UPI003098D89D